MAKKCPKCKSDNPGTATFCADCGTQLPSLEDIEVTKTLETAKEELTTGSTFAGRYQIIEKLGKGGMGRVYKVLDKETNEKIALKLIKPDIATDKKTVERFRNELTTARKIVQKNVCRMFDLGKEKGNYYITMEFVHGQDLKDLIRQTGQLAIGTTINIAKQICEGLLEAHKLGVVHRDLKPSNIMIDKEGNVRIMDFGIARSLKEKGITGAGVMIGTPEYMSPEQVESKEIDVRSDIYSLGIILYEMVTGHVPFEGDTPFSIGVKHKSDIPKAPKEINANIPDDLNIAIIRCLEKDKEKRYQSAGELYTELENIIKGIPTTTAVVIKKEPKTVKIGEIKWRNLIIYGGGAILLILIVFFGFFFITNRQKPLDSIAILPFENVSGDPELDYLSEGITESIIEKLAQLPTMRKVIARSSVFRYKGKEIDPQEVGQELDVDSLLISRMNQRGEDLSISVELVNTKNNSRIWGNQYKQNISGIFSIQEDITTSITKSLQLKLTGEENKKLSKRHTESIEAYEFYMRGRYFWNKRTKEGFEKAIEYFEKAIEEDHNFATAYSGLADCYSLLVSYGYLQQQEGFSKAKAMALKALSIDDTLAEAYASLGRIKHIHENDWSGAERDFMKAIELNNGYITAHQWYSTFLNTMGRHDEALDEMKTAIELDPLSVLQNRSLGRRFIRAGQYDRAIDTILKTIEMNPDFPALENDLGRAYYHNSMYEEALVVFQKVGNPLWIARTYAKMGDEEKLREQLSQTLARSKTTNFSNKRVAVIYFELGEIDKGFKWLQKAFEQREGLGDLKHNHTFDSVRSDPRFKEILKKMNLE